MRNLKKFLALVLAMLMVSACAISASAFTDSAAVSASDYKDAINGLAALKIVVGDSEGNFNPNKTLTRAEAAVMYAKYAASADGWFVEWTKETCAFDDVTAKWSFAYIDYVNDHSIMTGVGDNKFNPDGTLTVAEALTAAVKANKAAYVYYCGLDDAPANSAWYYNYVKAARVMGLADDLLIPNSEMTRAITKAEFAQIMWNLYCIEYSDSAAPAFGLNVVSGALTFDANYVYINGATGAKFTKAAFDAALAQFGIGGTYSDYAAGVSFTVKHKTGNYDRVYDLTIATTDFSTSAVVTSAKDSAGKYTTVTVDGTDYVVGSGSSAAYFGDSSVKGAAITVYNADGTVDSTYDFATSGVPAIYYASSVKSGNNITLAIHKVAVAQVAQDTDPVAKDLAVSGAATTTYTLTGIGQLAGDLATKTYAQISGKTRTTVFTGATFSMGDYIAYTYTTDENNQTIVINVVAVAAQKEGTLVAMNNTNKTYGIDSTTYAAETIGVAYDANNQDYLNHTVKYFTLNDMFLTMNNAANCATKNILVDSAVLNADGTVTISGIDTSNYTAALITVNGTYNAGTQRMVNAKFLQNTIDVYTAKDGKSFNKTASDKVKASATTVIYLTADGKALTNDKFVDNTVDGATVLDIATPAAATVAFEDAKTYSFKVLADGTAYYVGTAADAAFISASVNTISKFAVDASYVYDAGTSKYYNKAASVVTKSTATMKLNAYDAVSYALSSTVAQTYSANVALFDEAYAATTTMGAKVKLVYIDATSAAPTTANTITAIENDGKLIQILNATGTYNYGTVEYQYVNVLTGAVETVELSTTVTVDAGKFYILNADGTVALASNGTTAATATTDRLWIAPKNIYKETNGLESNYYIAVSKLVETGAGTKMYNNTDDSKLSTLGLDVKVYTLDAAGKITVKDGAAVLDTTYKIADQAYTGSSVVDGKTVATYTLTAAYYVGGTLIIIK